LKQWLGVQNGWTFEVCEVDLFVGGRYRYVWRSSEGFDMGMGGVFREVDRPKRIVCTELFDQAWYPGEALVTNALTEKDGRTTCTLTIQYESEAARDAVLASPMESGLATGFANLDALLPSLA
jgi:uncharacterized protein YndB with AHSA1/START domain